jgi:hypothetical protein
VEEEEEEEMGEEEVASGTAWEAANAAAPGSDAPKKRNPFYDLFPSDEDEDEDEDEGARRGVSGRRRGGKRNGAAASADGDSDDESVSSYLAMMSVGAGGEGRSERFLDERFSKLLAAEYSDDEIGELDPDDPRVNGEEELEVRETQITGSHRRHPRSAPPHRPAPPSRLPMALPAE